MYVCNTHIHSSTLCMYTCVGVCIYIYYTLYDRIYIYYYILSLSSQSIYANSDYEIREHMKLYVGKFVHWFTINNLKLNIEKTIILPYFNTIILNSIKIDNVDIELVNYYKCVCITLDSKLKY